jgi:hypothetical protein
MVQLWDLRTQRKLREFDDSPLTKVNGRRSLCGSAGSTAILGQNRTLAALNTWFRKDRSVRVN